MSSSRLNYGYVIVTAGFFVFGGLLSPINSYGRIFTSIQQDLNTTALQAGWIGSIAWASNFLIGPLAVVVESHIGYCATTVLGSVITSAGYLISSFMGSFGWLLLVLGIVCGSGSGMCIHSCFCVLLKYFKISNQTGAAGLVASGASVDMSGNRKNMVALMTIPGGTCLNLKPGYMGKFKNVLYATAEILLGLIVQVLRTKVSIRD